MRRFGKGSYTKTILRSEIISKARASKDLLRQQKLGKRDGCGSNLFELC